MPFVPAALLFLLFASQQSQLVLAASTVCVEHFSASPFPGGHLYLGAVPVPSHHNLLVAFSSRGNLIRIHAETGERLGDVATVQVFSSGGEQGLLSLAFRPDFATSGKFYTWGNTVQRDSNDLAIDEWTCADPGAVATCTRTGPVLEVDHPFSNHNGGSLMFDAKHLTYLYLSLGDGGSSCDPENMSRDETKLLGKILRIDLGPASAANFNYSVPASNPLASAVDVEMCGKNLLGQKARTTKRCAEVFAKGLRNPYRCSIDSFDPENRHNIYCGDVGQATMEEVDSIPTTTKGNGVVPNYGWDVFEGTRGALGYKCTGSRKRCPLNKRVTVNRETMICPIAEETHVQGWASLIGGYVCRKCGDNKLVGRYLYADYFKAGTFRALKLNGTRRNKLKLKTQLCTNAAKCIVQPPPASPLETNWMVFSFAQDLGGRISLIHATRGLYRIIALERCQQP